MASLWVCRCFFLLVSLYIMQFVNSWTMGVEGADFPDFNLWGKRLLGDVLQPKRAVASICPHDWNQIGRAHV